MLIKKRANIKPTSVFQSSRTDGRYFHPFWATYYRLKDHRPKLAFNPDLPGHEFASWTAAVKRRLNELVGLDEFPAPAESKRLWSAPRDGYTLQKWEAYPEPYTVYPFYMLIPDGVDEKAPAPAVICGPGGSGRKEALAGEPQLDGSVDERFPEHNCQARHYARAGYIALASDSGGDFFEPTNSDEPVPEDRDDYFHELWMGRCSEAISVIYRIQLLRWLRTCPFVNADRIAVSAHSMSTPHMLMAALLEPTVRAVVFNDFVLNWRERQIAVTLPSLGNAHLLPGMINWFDYVDLMASLAPTPLLVTEGGRTRDIERVRQAYAKAGASENFMVYYYPKYALPENRPYDNADLPEGLGDRDYLPYANVDAVDHYFKEDLAIPWLNRILRR